MTQNPRRGPEPPEGGAPRISAKNHAAAAGGHIIDSAVGTNSSVIKFVRNTTVQVRTGALAVALVLPWLLSTSTPPDIGSPLNNEPLQVAPDTTYDWVSDCARRHLRRSVELIDPTEEAVIEVEDTVPVVVGDVWLDISISATESVDLHLDRIRIEEIGREHTPRTGVLLRPNTGTGCAQGFVSHAWEVALDEGDPSLYPRDLHEEPDGSVSRVMFPYPIPDEGVTLRLYFSSDGCECRFRVVLDWLRDGKPTEPTRLPDNGQRFHVIPNADLPEYQLLQSTKDEPVIEPVS